MAFALPAVLGGTGGWLPLLATSFLIGSWLLFPKAQQDNEVIDTGAEEMPRVNQALRGVTINTMFGTNRVASNITWTKNWNTIRHESSSSGGGGKGGGSGGSKQPEQPGEVSYTYTWDVMFTIGMVPERYSLYGGWMNQQRMNNGTISAIAQDLSVFTFKNPNGVPDEATLEFTDAFYSGGAPTGADVDSWTYWENQEGFPCRWPHIVYIGFQTLNLGNTAALPSLEWEVGPGEADFNFDSAYIDQAASNSTSDAQHPGVHQFIIGDDGERYTVGIELSETAHIQKFDVDAGTYAETDTLTGSDFDADMKAYGKGIPSTADYNYNTTWTASMLQNSDKYFIVWGYGGLNPALNRGTIGFGLYKINASGQAEIVGAHMTRSNSVLGALRPGFIKSAAIANAGTDLDPIVTYIIDQISFTIEGRILVWPSITVLTDEFAALVKDSSQGETDYNASSRSVTNVTVDGETIGERFGYHTSDRYGDTSRFGWFMPKAVVTPVGVSWETTLNFYIGKASIQWHDDNPGLGYPTLSSTYIYDTLATYPNGHALKLDYGVINYDDGPASPTTSIINDKFVDYTTEDVIMPFDDEGKAADGTTETISGYSSYPTVQKVTVGEATGMYAVMWGKMFQPSSGNSTTGEYIKVRGFLYRPDTEQYFEFDTGEGTTLDTVSDLGQTEGDRYKGSYYNVNPVWDQSTGILYKVGMFHGGIAYPPGDVHISQSGQLDISGVGDVLPPYIIYQILTNTVFGTGVAAADVDQASYTDALAYCRAEEILCSTQYTREGSKLEAIEEVLALYGGYLTVTGGKIKFGVMDTSQTPVRVIDNEHLVSEKGSPPVKITVAAREDSFNKILVNYLDRSLEYRQNQISLDDEVDQDLRGVFKKEFPPKFVISEATATKIGLRSLWSNLYGKDTYDFPVGMKDSDLEAGDVVTLVDSYHPNHPISSGIDVRITRIKESKRGIFQMTAVDEIQYIATASDAPSNVSSISGRDPIYGPSRIPANQWAYELPREFQGSSPKVYIGYNQLSYNRGAWLYASEDGTSYAQVMNAEPFPISGILAEPLPSRPDGYMEQNVKIFLFPDTRSGFTASSPVYVNTFALEDLDAGGRQSGLATLIVGSEAMSYQGLTLVSQNHYVVQRLYRGWGGTHIQGHSSGAYWHKHGGGVFGFEYNEDKIGTTFSYKVIPYNFAGQGVDVSSVNASTHTIDGAYFRPQIQGTMHTFAHSVQNGQSSVDLRGLERVGVVAGGTNIDFLWSESARMSGWGTQGYGAGGYGRFTQDIASPTYRVEVLSNDLTTVVRCETVNTGFWTYSVDINSTDFNGWNGDFQVKMTPYNQYGDAPRSATKRLRAF